jgi:UDP-N-acetylglucosamine 1-carboxyvinyltransferase
VEHALISDLPEIVTFIACAVHTETPLTLGAVTSEAARAGLAAELELLDEMGVGVEWGDQRVRVHPGDNVRPVRIDVSPDGVSSDHAPFFALMGCRARGRSVIRERVWTRRFAYVPELVKLGAAMSVSGSELNVRPRRLSGADGDLHATDLRAAAVLTLAALDSPRPTRITGVHHLARGYENLARKLTALGAHIEEER